MKLLSTWVWQVNVHEDGLVYVYFPSYCLQPQNKNFPEEAEWFKTRGVETTLFSGPGNLPKLKSFFSEWFSRDSRRCAGRTRGMSRLIGQSMANCTLVGESYFGQESIQCMFPTKQKAHQILITKTPCNSSKVKSQIKETHKLLRMVLMRRRSHHSLYWLIIWLIANV